MIHLPTVTLCCIDTRHEALARRALDRSQRGMTFGEVVYLRDLPISSLEEYSYFVLKGLGDHIDTEHVLLTQWDGYVCTPEAWDDRFLDYDYIGAPWDTGDVGNGGFSLRSRKLLQATQEPDIDMPYINEDVVICFTHRGKLEERGIRFAPLDVAQRFAFEMDITPIRRGAWPFGFHGLFNLAYLESEAELVELAAMLPEEIVRSQPCAGLLHRLHHMATHSVDRKWRAIVALGERIGSPDALEKVRHAQSQLPHA